MDERDKGGNIIELLRIVLFYFFKLNEMKVGK